MSLKHGLSRYPAVTGVPGGRYKTDTAGEEILVCREFTNAKSRVSHLLRVLTTLEMVCILVANNPLRFFKIVY